jgi:hypothetical protein
MSLSILEKIRDELEACNAIGSTREFCRSWLAKDESYLRVLRFHNQPASADALATCASKLGYFQKHLARSEKPEHKALAETFQRLRTLCVVTMDEQARSKWMTVDRMDL